MHRRPVPVEGANGQLEPGMCSGSPLASVSTSRKRLQPGVHAAHRVHCKGEEYETREPTNKLDRVCAAHPVRRRLRAESQAPTVNSDRVCTDLTECVSGVEYESQEPTDKSNRVLHRV